MQYRPTVLPTSTPLLLALFASGCASAPPAPPPFPEARNPILAEIEAEQAKRPRPEPPEWPNTVPIETRSATFDGCIIDARRVRPSLSVDGTSAGVFLSDMSGQRGEVSLDPKGTSAAHVSYGAATFDTKVSLADTKLPFPDKPPPLGGILFLSPYASARVVGGDKDVLDLAPVDAKGDFEWVTSPRVPTRCDAFANKKRWNADPFPETATAKDAVAVHPMTPVRATASGPVVAEVALHRVAAFAEAEGAVRIVADTPLGVLVGFTDPSELRPWEAPPKPAPAGGSGMGMMAPTRVSCPFGTPLYLLSKDRLHRVGRLRDATDPEGPKLDWRTLRKDGVVLDGPPGGIHAGDRYAVLRDDFRITNDLWHQGVGGKFVVPLGEGACSVATR